MRSIIFISFIAITLAGCNNAAKPVEQTNSAPAAVANDKPQTAIAHSSDNKSLPGAPAANGSKSHWTQSGDPIDTKKYDGVIDAAKKNVDKNPNDEKAKKVAAEAYLDRANALTQARQYASALGDYRRVIKYDPANEEAKNWIEQITAIYESMNRDAPKEGEEPPPLPFKAGGDEK